MNLPVDEKIIAMGKLFQFNEQEMIYLVFNVSMIKLAICRKFAGKTEDRETLKYTMIMY